MDDHYIPTLITRLRFESDNPLATLAEIKLVVEVLEVQPKKITMLADTAMRAKDLDVAAAPAQLHLLEKIKKAARLR